jgi:hypothetical protein
MEDSREMWQKRDVRKLIGFSFCAVMTASTFVFSCGHHSSSDDTTTTTSDGGVIDRARLPAKVYIDASTPDTSCIITIDTPPLEPGIHVPVGTPITWDSNPPCSGQHYPIWAAYQEYVDPVPRGFYVHDEEHGGVVLLYNCPADASTADGGACPDIVDGLRAASAQLPDDPLCTAAGEGVRVRTVITPDPLIPTKVAAAAWGWIYTADCLDQKSLNDFVNAHYGQGTEMLCANGQTNFATGP